MLLQAGFWCGFTGAGCGLCMSGVADEVCGLHIQVDHSNDMQARLILTACRGTSGNGFMPNVMDRFAWPLAGPACGGWRWQSGCEWWEVWARLEGGRYNDSDWLCRIIVSVKG